MGEFGKWIRRIWFRYASAGLQVMAHYTKEKVTDMYVDLIDTLTK